MRVNHVGEVCAQALCSAQALATRDPPCVASSNRRPARKPITSRGRRSACSNSARASLLNPLWYGRRRFRDRPGRRPHFGDAASLGFLVETERQVERHLEGHLDRLPAHDSASRAIVDQMRADEARHADAAQAAGAAALPAPVRWAMKAPPGS